MFAFKMGVKRPFFYINVLYGGGMRRAPSVRCPYIERRSPNASGLGVNN